MGYETKMFIVESKKKVGYQRVLAHMELNRVCYNRMEELILRTTSERNISHSDYEKVDRLKELENDIYDGYGNHTHRHDLLSKDSQKALSLELMKLEDLLENKFPYIFVGEKMAYTDAYGEFLIVVSLEEVESAILKDNAQYVIENGFSYYAFDVALAMLKSFKESFGSGLKVVLYGH